MAKLEQKSGGELREPVVAILGHIDHGKSTLIDYIRKSNVIGKEADIHHVKAGSGLAEAGGITQHASAYEIERKSKDGKRKKITFIDTPGHEAFIKMRTRCANVADIAVLIVSAEDGVKPQTLEVIKYIKECSLPFMVAITKIDKPSANVANTKQSLAESGVYVEGYGGDTPVVELSAVTGAGVDDLLDMITLISEMEGKRAEKEALGSGVIIESHLDPKRGITAVGIIKDGTVRRSLFAASSSGSSAPIRFILDAEGKTVDELSFSSPVQIVGWDKIPAIGSEFKTFLKKEEALAYANTQARSATPEVLPVGNMEDIVALPIVLKADTAGSLEVVSNELGKLARERITPKIIASSVGGVNENDVKSALVTKGAVIVGFNTKVDAQAAALAERSGISILSFNIIYELTDKVSELLTKREPKIEVEEVEGSAKVLKLFGATKGKQVLGGRVLSGQIKKGGVVKIIRRESEIGRGKIKEMQKAKVAINSADEGEEFGAMIESKMEIAPGDILNSVIIVTK